MSAATRAKTAKERATIAIRMMKTNKSGDFGRAFDDCFEMGDGDAVVTEIARRAMRNPALLELVKRNRGVAWSSVEAALNTLGFTRGGTAMKFEITKEEFLLLEEALEFAHTEKMRDIEDGFTDSEKEATEFCEGVSALTAKLYAAEKAVRP